MEPLIGCSDAGTLEIMMLWEAGDKVKAVDLFSTCVIVNKPDLILSHLQRYTYVRNYYGQHFITKKKEENG